MRKIGNIAFTLLFCFVAITTKSQDKYFVEAQISNANPSQHEEIQLTYSLQYKGNSISLINPRYEVTRPKDLEQNFKILNEGASGGMDMNFGKITVYKYTYVLQAKSAGKAIIQPFSIRFQDKTYTSKSLTVNVRAGSAPPKDLKANKFFIQATTTKRSVYKGEEFRVSYKLFSKYELTSISEEKAPLFNGFVAKSLADRSKQRQLRVESVNGEKFNVLDLGSYKLHSLKTGEQLLDPYEIGVVANVPTGRYVQDFFGRRRQQVQRKQLQVNSHALKIEIKDFPEAGKPADFYGAVGSFNFSASLDNSNTETEQPVTLNVRIQGNGNILNIQTPKPAIPPSFEIYDPKVKQNSSNSIGSTNNYKSFDFLLIPTNPGQYKIPPLSFSYFDPEKERYFTKKSEEFTVTVGGEAIGSQMPSTGLNKEEVELLGEDIRFIKQKDVDLSPSSGQLFNTGRFYGLFASPALLFLVLVFVRRKQRDSQSDVVGLKNKRASKVAKKSLRKAAGFMKKNEESAFYKEVSQALWSYLSNKLNIDIAVLSRESALEALAAREIAESDRDELVSLLDECEMALFAPSAVSGGMQGVYQRAEKLILSLENTLKS